MATQRTAVMGCFIPVAACPSSIPGYHLELRTASSQTEIETVSFDRWLCPAPLSQWQHNMSQWRPMGSMMIRHKLPRGFCGPATDQREEKATNVTFVYQLISTSLIALAQLWLVSNLQWFMFSLQHLKAVQTSGSISSISSTN